MKYFIYLIFFLFNFNFILAQPTIEWQKCFGGLNTDRATSIKQTKDGGYVVAGMSLSIDGDVTTHFGNSNLSDFWIVKLDNTGNIEWENSYGGTLEDYPNSIVETNDGGFIIAGLTQSKDSNITAPQGGKDFWILKINNIGSMQWQKSLGGSNADAAYSIIQTNDGGYIVAGASSSSDGDVLGHHGSNTTNDYWIVKLDTLGEIQWQKSLGGSNNDEAYSIRQTTDGGYIIAGSAASYDGNVTAHHGQNSPEYWIVKLNHIGSIQWQKTLGGSSVDKATSIQQTPDGGFIIAGNSSSNDGDITSHHGVLGMDDIWIVKISNTGSLEWQTSLGGTASDQASAIELTNDDGYIVSGSTCSSDGDVSRHLGNNLKYDYWIVKLNIAGSILWQKSVGGTAYDIANSIQQVADGGYIIAGYTDSNDSDVTGQHQPGYSDFWIVKLSPLVNINEIQSSITNFAITPNPVIIETKINFNLSSLKNASIEISDIEGRKIKYYGKEIFNLGSNKISWDGNNNFGIKVDNGIYFVKIDSDNSSVTKKVVVICN